MHEVILFLVRNNIALIAGNEILKCIRSDDLKTFKFPKKNTKIRATINLQDVEGSMEQDPMGWGERGLSLYVADP